MSLDLGVALALFSAGLLVSCALFSCVLVYLRGEFRRQWKRVSDERLALSAELAANASTVHALAADLRDELQRLTETLQDTNRADGSSWPSPRRESWSRVQAIEAVRAGLGTFEAAQMLGVPPSEMRLIAECVRLDVESLTPRTGLAPKAETTG